MGHPTRRSTPGGGVYAGRAGRTTSTPGAELLLDAMKTVRVSVAEAGGQEYALLSPPTDVQAKLLKLWGSRPTFITSCAATSPKRLQTRANRRLKTPASQIGRLPDKPGWLRKAII
ncbi:hypothetical protein [Fimbriiglobus ruber]|uniref:hypothetical protein n=1 Tax=Fimbriiglobus ruber TaxID=1908690 RepID=UPI001179D3C6|nr:hypothetical protein [Fimbriiglobus ruber]